MADFVPPTGPPPPKVPAGWKAVWNDQYSEWFYVNIHTKQSQWDKPSEPVYGDSEAPPSHPPPSYASHPNPSSLGPEKGGYPGTSNPDEALARRLQAEENARAEQYVSQSGPAQGNRGAADDYYRQNAGTGVQSGPAPPLGGGQYNTSMPVNETKSKGLLGRLTGSSHQQPHPQAYPQAQYAPQGGYYQQGYPAQGGMMQGGYGGGYAAAPQVAPRKKHGIGMGGAALGLGGGLLGGMLIGDMIGDAGDGGDGGGFGGDGGGFGGDGGDFGGGDGGGDFGGGGGDF